jgi:hypothetical protein
VYCSKLPLTISSCEKDAVVKRLAAAAAIIRWNMRVLPERELLSGPEAWRFKV